MSHACGWNESQDTLDHSEPSPKNRNERELLPADLESGGLLKGCMHRDWIQRQLRCRLVRHEHRDLVDELLEYFRGSPAVTKQRNLVLHERMTHERQVRERRGGGHGREATIFAPMKEYQAVIHRLTRR